MSIEAVIYFNGPETQWLRKVAPDDIIARRVFRYRWLARMWASSVMRNLDPTRVGYAVIAEGAVIELREVFE